MAHPYHWYRRPWRLSMLRILTAVWFAAACQAPFASAQSGRDTIPSTAYFLYFSDYYEGRYSDALKGYVSEGRGSIKGTSGRWLDSICYHTMAGECHYHLGHYDDALEQS